MKQRVSARFSIDFHKNTPAWSEMLHAEGLKSDLHSRGQDWTERLNAELHEAQARRNQPVEDGYDYTVTTGGTRDRLYVRAYTARAMAHEAANQSLLKLMMPGGPKNVHPVDPNLPSELAERSIEAQGGVIGGNRE
jgi:hypothetical protein